MCKRTAPVQLFREGLSEEAAAPEFSETRRSAFLKTLPMIHPRESSVTTSSVTVASRLNASHVCTGVTLSESQINRNGKLMWSCAETVEDKTCLWKGKEKAEGNRGPRICTDEHGPIFFCSWQVICFPEKRKGTTEVVPLIRIDP